MIRFTNNIAHGLKIKREDVNGVAFHTINEWGLAIVNTDYIGEPQLETLYIDVPYTDGRIDATEAVSGRPIYKSREIKVTLKGFRERMNWDAVMSDIRNKINGRVCHFIFDNDKAYYWRGRVYVEDFNRAKECGYFTLRMDADAYKYNIYGVGDSWIWDTFNFLTDSVKDGNEFEVDGTATFVVPKGNMALTPDIDCRAITTGLTVSDGRITAELENGTNYEPRILVNGDTETVLTFNGHGFVSIKYRGGSL